MNKGLITTGAIVGGLIGNTIPVLLWKSNGFDFSSVIGALIGGLAGIALMVMLANRFGD